MHCGGIQRNYLAFIGVTINDCYSNSLAEICNRIDGISLLTPIRLQNGFSELLFRASYLLRYSK